MAAKNGSNGANGEMSVREGHLETLRRSAELLEEDDLGRLAQVSLLLAGWNKARGMVKEASVTDPETWGDEVGRTEYHLGNIRKRLGQAYRAGMTRAAGGYLDMAAEAIQRETAAVAEAADAS